MSRLQNGVLLALLQVALVVSVAAKYYVDRSTLPRAWARATTNDPDLPIRGRYLSLRILVEVRDAGSLQPGRTKPVRLSAEDGKLTAAIAGSGGLLVRRERGGGVELLDPVAFFIPEHVPDPSRRPPGEELWVEVSVPKEGPPRPIRLAVKKDGALTPLPLD